MNREKILNEFNVLARCERLPSARQITLASKRALAALRSEPASCRERILGTEEPGGLLDFTDAEPCPVVVVPDIHARPDFVLNILRSALPKRLTGFKSAATVFDALQEKRIFLVCVGDILHAEGRARERWLMAWNEHSRGALDSRFMREEMREGLSALLAVMKCKALWPERFHCLKGNHENIMNEFGEGNFPFRKFAYEGKMVFDFMGAVYGGDVLKAARDFEKALPLAAAFKNVFVSHAEPKEFLGRERMVNGAKDERVVRALTWTANDEAEEGGVQKMLAAHCAPQEGVEPRYLGGHRPVSENYLLRQGGLYVQIHNPNRQNVAVVRPDKTFDPAADILRVG